MISRVRQRARSRSELGVSLIELLLAITITTILVVPLGGAIFFGLRTTDATQTRLQQSNKADSLAALFGPDVQSAATAATGVPEDPAACGGTATTVDLLLTLQPGVSSISYYRVTSGTAPNTTTILYRRTCNAGSATAGIPVTQAFTTPPSSTTNNPFGVVVCGINGSTPYCWSVQVALTQQDANRMYPYATNLQATLRVN
jgi:Tfp pilus assembly protein PilV